MRPHLHHISWQTSIRRLGMAALLATRLAAQASTTLPTWKVAPQASAGTTRHEGTIEAVRQTVMAAQVAGTVVRLSAQAGERVRAGQPLVQLDARSALQQAGAAAAQLDAAGAAQDVAAQEFRRQQQLFEQGYISPAALERAEAQFKAASAQARAQRASAGVAHTESGHFMLRAPYDAIVSDVPVMLGDLALPGRPLLTLFDPTALRVAVAVPESLLPRLQSAQGRAAEVDVAGQRIVAARWEMLPAADPATHTVTVRVALPFPLPTGATARPGSFARVQLPLGPQTSASGDGRAEARLFIPGRALLQRAELRAVYVLDAQDRPLLRQVRTGRAQGDQVEVLTGLTVGERVVLEPQRVAGRP